MQVEVRIQGRPEALDEGHSAALRVPHGAELASAPDQGREHRFRKDTKNIGHHAAIVSQPVAEGVRKRKHPLADRTCGNTPSTRCAAVSDILRPQQLLQKPRFLREYGTKRSSPQLSQWRRLCTKNREWPL